VYTAANVQDGYRSSQNAVELVLKTLILVKCEALPRSHGGCIHKFGELYVVKGEVEREMITRVYIFSLNQVDNGTSVEEVHF
jgi:uncharacterized protein (UPF0332 family)